MNKSSATVTPDYINDVPDEILNKILECTACGKNYVLIHMEPEFYRKMNISVPRECSDCRGLSRIRKLNPMDAYGRSCDKYREDMEISYVPKRKEVIYCKACYQAEVK